MYDRPTIGRGVEETTEDIERRRGRQRSGRRAQVVTIARVERKEYRQKYTLPRPSPDVPSVFRLIRGEFGYSAYWTYHPMPRLTVNGIYITDSDVRAYFSKGTD